MNWVRDFIDDTWVFKSRRLRAADKFLLAHNAVSYYVSKPRRIVVPLHQLCCTRSLSVFSFFWLVMAHSLKSFVSSCPYKLGVSLIMKAANIEDQIKLCRNNQTIVVLFFVITQQFEDHTKVWLECLCCCNDELTSGLLSYEDLVVSVCLNKNIKIFWICFLFWSYCGLDRRPKSINLKAENSNHNHRLN